MLYHWRRSPSMRQRSRLCSLLRSRRRPSPSRLCMSMSSLTVCL